jgi:hypothetical protein
MSGISPELVLIDPELRAYALAALPPVREFGFLDLRRIPNQQAPAVAPTFHISAALAYLALAIGRTIAFDAVVFACVAAVVLLTSLFA